MPTSTKWTKRSPKGLREVTLKHSTGGDITDFFELVPGRYPGEWVTVPKWRDMLRQGLAKLRGQMLADGGKENLPDGWEDKAASADPAFFASSVLHDLTNVESLLSEMDKRTEAEAIRRAAYEAMNAILGLMADLESWLLVANERALAAGLGSIDGARDGGHQKAEKKKPRNIEMALEYERRSATWRGSPTSLKTDIGKRWQPRPLKERAAATAIDTGLKILRSQRGILRD